MSARLSYDEANTWLKSRGGRFHADRGVPCVTAEGYTVSFSLTLSHEAAVVAAVRDLMTLLAR